MSDGEDWPDLSPSKDEICSEFTHVLRNLMRAVVSNSDPRSAVSRALHHMNQTMELCQSSEERITFHDLFSHAVEDLRIYEYGDYVDREMVGAAEAGASFLLERTCTDGLARARTSKRQHQFLQAIRFVEEARAERRAEMQKKLFEQRPMGRKASRKKADGA